MEDARTVTTNSPEETIELGAQIAHALREGDVIALVGNLGTGKTVFVKGLAKGLDVEDYIYVNSPSFVVVKEYSGEKKLYHFDIYRLELKDFCESLDYERYFYDDGVVVIEWAEKIRDLLPEEYLEVNIFHEDSDKRRFVFRSNGEKFKELVGRIGQGA